MKIKTITVENFKAISLGVANFDGCSAIVTGGNNKGKTSIMRGLIDRFNGEKPELIVKKDEQKGFYLMELTDGSKIEWKFTEKGEKITYFTHDGFKVPNALTEIGKRYFGTPFDIDKFLNSTPTKQNEKLQKLLGIDFTEIDKKLEVAMDDRKFQKRNFAEIAAQKRPSPDPIEKADVKSKIDALNLVIVSNNKLVEKWKTDNIKHLETITDFNKDQTLLKTINDNLEGKYNEIRNLLSGTEFVEFFDQPGAETVLKERKKVQPSKPVVNLPEPEYAPTIQLEIELESERVMETKHNDYVRDDKEFKEWLESGKKARKSVDKSEALVLAIKNQKNRIIKDAKIPEEFEITDNGIEYNGLPLSNAQLSSSAKYIAALKLGQIGLGELQTMHFDASFLDNISLAEIQKWADENDLQLLIERPDMDGGEIQYNIIQNEE